MTNNQIRTVGVIGMGGIGGFISPRLHARLGDGFFVVADGERKERLEKGMVINGERYFFPVKTPAELEPADLVIFTTKRMQLEQAMKDAAGMVGPGTIVISLLNGIDSEEALKAAYPQAHVLKALVQVPATNDHGAITVPMDKGKIVFGEDRNETVTPEVKAVQELLSAANIIWETPLDMDRAQWMKFMANVSENQIAAVLGLTYGHFQASEDALILCRKVREEVTRVGMAAGVALTMEDASLRETYLMKLRPEGKPSTYQDMEAGRPTEVEMFSGRVMELAGQTGVEVPYCTFLYHAIKVLEGKDK